MYQANVTLQNLPKTECAISVESIDWATNERTIGYTQKPICETKVDLIDHIANETDRLVIWCDSEEEAQNKCADDKGQESAIYLYLA